jgi:hypothetical protein
MFGFIFAVRLRSGRVHIMLTFVSKRSRVVDGTYKLGADDIAQSFLERCRRYLFRGDVWEDYFVIIRIYFDISHFPACFRSSPLAKSFSCLLAAASLSDAEMAMDHTFGDRNPTDQDAERSKLWSIGQNQSLSGCANGVRAKP